MNRRDFFRTLGLAAAGAAVEHVRKKSYFFLGEPRRVLTLAEWARQRENTAPGWLQEQRLEMFYEGMTERQHECLRECLRERWTPLAGQYGDGRVDVREFTGLQPRYSRDPMDFTLRVSADLEQKPGVRKWLDECGRRLADAVRVHGVRVRAVNWL